MRDIRDLCGIFDVSLAERDRLVALAKQAKEQGWWQSYDLPFGTPLYVGLEAEAVASRIMIRRLSRVCCRHRTMYAHCTTSRCLSRLPVKLTPELVDQRVKARLRRQELLSRQSPQPLQFWTILDEAVLHRAIGGPAVMRAQLELVVEKMQLPNVTVQVIPYSVGAHPALDSTFNILEFAVAVPDIVYSEGGGLHLYGACRGC